jgi:hypothetical protein
MIEEKFWPTTVSFRSDKFEHFDIFLANFRVNQSAASLSVTKDALDLIIAFAKPSAKMGSAQATFLEGSKLKRP